jgi:hypothetical protein
VESPRFVKECSEAYRTAVKDYIIGKIVKRMAAIRNHHGMFEAVEHDDEWGDEVDFTLGASSMLLSCFPQTRILTFHCRGLRRRLRQQMQSD